MFAFRRSAAIVVASAAIVAPTLARAQIDRAVVRLRPVPAVRRAPVPASRWRPNAIGPRTFYGTIAALRGTAVTVRLRSGRLQPIDAAQVIASGNYSAPLFVGKIVEVDGAFANGTFVASHVLRLTRLEGLQGDR